MDVDGPWAGDQIGGAWFYRNYDRRSGKGLFKEPLDATSQGVVYGSAFQGGANVTAIKHDALHLEFLVNSESQGVVMLKKPLPAGAVGCVSACPAARPAVQLSLGDGKPLQPPLPPPPTPPTPLMLQTCDGSAAQHFIYLQEARTLSQGGNCLQMEVINGYPDPSMFSKVVLGPCPKVVGALGAGEGSQDSTSTAIFTWSPDPELRYIRSVYASCNVCIGVCADRHP